MTTDEKLDLIIETLKRMEARQIHTTAEVEASAEQIRPRGTFASGSETEK